MRSMRAVKSREFKIVQRLAHAAATHIELLGEFALSGQPVPRQQRAIGDLPADLVAHGLEGAPRSDRLEHRSRSIRHFTLPAHGQFAIDHAVPS